MTSILLSPGECDAQLARQLEASGARVIRWPETSIIETSNQLMIDQAIENLFGYDWLVLKNEYAAEYFLKRFLRQRVPAELDELRVLAIGEAAAGKLMQSHTHVDVELARFSITKTYGAIESYAGGRASLARLNFLIPSANVTCELFEQQLEDAGARVDNVAAYGTTSDNRGLTQIKALLAGGGIDCVVFSSPSAILEFGRLFDTDDLSRFLASATVACGNGETEKVAAQFGLVHSIALPEPNPSPVTLAKLVTTSLRSRQRTS